MAIDKITYPLTGKELSAKINEIIENMGAVDDVEVTDSYSVKIKKADGTETSFTVPKADASADGLLSASDYTFLQSLKQAKDSETAALPMVIPYATCTTSSSVVDKVATINNGGLLTKLTKGAVVMVEFQNAPFRTDGAKITLNVNNTGKKTVLFSGIDNGYYTSLAQAKRLMFVYDGDYWICISPTVDVSNWESGGGD